MRNVCWWRSFLTPSCLERNSLIEKHYRLKTEGYWSFQQMEEQVSTYWEIIKTSNYIIPTRNSILGADAEALGGFGGWLGKYASIERNISKLTPNSKYIKFMTPSLQREVNNTKIDTDLIMTIHKLVKLQEKDWIWVDSWKQVTYTLSHILTGI